MRFYKGAGAKGRQAGSSPTPRLSAVLAGLRWDICVKYSRCGGWQNFAKTFCCSGVNPLFTFWVLCVMIWQERQRKGVVPVSVILKRAVGWCKTADEGWGTRLGVAA